METKSINASKRDRIGTRYARRLRATGKLPAVIYGHKEDPLAIAVDQKEALHLLHHGVKLFSIDIEGTSETCLIKDLQFDHLGTDIIHLDFARVDLTEEVNVQVALRFLGEAAGLKETGAIFRTVNESLEVRCIATAIPGELTVDVSSLEVGDHLTAGDVPMPEGVALQTDPESLICRVAIVAEIEEPEEEAVEAMVEGEAEGAEGGGEAAGEAGGEEAEKG